MMNDTKRKPWTRDELILAINVYCRTPFGRIHMRNPDVMPQGLTREAVVRTRVNQQFFRDMIMASYDERCCITGLPVRELLVASHIVPWAEDAANRMNPRNGLCLNALHDRAFDKGLITLDTDFRVVLSPRLRRESPDDVRLLSEYAGTPIRLPRRFRPDQALLERHRSMIFRWA